MSTKQITLICSSFPPEKGAAPGRMYQLALLLLRNGYSVTVLCAMPNYPTGKIFDAYGGKFVSEEYIEGIRVVRSWLIPTNSSNKLKRTVSQLSYISSLLLLVSKQLIKSKPDLVLVSSPPFVTGYLGCLLAKKLTKAKVILNISDLWPKTAYDLGFFKDGPLYRFLLRREQKMYRLADTFTVQSEQIRRHIQTLRPSAGIFIYRNLQQYTPQSEIPRPEGKKIIVYAGLLGIAQGVYEIVKNIDFASSGTELHIYGQGNELGKIEAWIRQHPERGVSYMGSVAAHAIPDILTKYHAMLVPLTQPIEGAVPSKIFNAIANGLPVLFSGDGEGAEIVNQTNTGWVNRPGDYLSLQKNIETMVTMPQDKYDKMRAQCIACNTGIFNKTTQDESFIQFLRGPELPVKIKTKNISG